jgi:hypothetical protein
MIALETLDLIDAVASRHGLHSGEVRILLSAQFPGWITPMGQDAVQGLLAHWLDQGIDTDVLRRDLPALAHPVPIVVTPCSPCTYSAHP